jgi:predicted  nucleic acid-binding Zn-ribbon protein
MDYNENNELKNLSHEITRLITRVDYHEKEISDNRIATNERFAKLEEKLDELKESFGEMKGDIKALLVKIGLIGGGALLALEFIGKVLKLW